MYSSNHAAHNLAKNVLLFLAFGFELRNVLFIFLMYLYLMQFDNLYLFNFILAKKYLSLMVRISFLFFCYNRVDFFLVQYRVDFYPI